MPRRDFTKSDWAIVAALFVAVIALYARSAGFAFINYDDDQYVFENPHIRNGVTWSAVGWAVTSGYAANWHPLTWVSHMLDVELFGLSPAGPHVVNFCLHAANASLLFIALRLLTGARWAAAGCAALFALHPLRVESVAWISERKDVLSGLFWMSSMIAYERFVAASRDKRATDKRLRYAALLVLFSLGLMSKPMVVTLPCVLLLLDFWPLHRTGAGATWPKLFLEKWPLFLLAAGSSAATFFAQQSGRAMVNVAAISLPQRLANAIVSTVDYLQQTFWPTRLAVFYPHPYSIPGGKIVGGAIIAAALVLIAVSAAALLMRRRAPWLIVGWLWFLGTLVPVIGLVQVGTQSRADRYTYLPMIGLTIALLWTMEEISRRSRTAAVTCAGVFIVALAALTIASHHQIGYWRDSETLMRHAIAVVPNNYAAHNNLGHALDEKGDHAGAEEQYRAVLAINAADAIAMNNLAVRLAERGEIDQAITLYRRSIARDPNYAPAYVQLANVLARRGELDAAISLYRQAIERDPALPDAYHNLAVTQTQRGEFADALDNWNIALRLKPDYPDALHANGLALIISGRPGAGIETLRRALALEPDRVDTKIRLAWTLATHPQAQFRDVESAVRLAGEAVDRSAPDDATALDTLAAAEAAAGQFDRAIAHARRAAAAAEHTDRALAAAIGARLSLYEARKPYIQPGRAGAE